MKEAVTEPLRPTVPAIESGWLTVVQDTVNNESETLWHGTEEIANTVANHELEEARTGEYDVAVFVLKCVRQGSHKE